MNFNNDIGGSDAYFLSKAKRAKETFDEAVKNAKFWNRLWTYISYTIDIFITVSGILVALNNEKNFMPVEYSTYLISGIVMLKGSEFFSNYKAKVVTSNVLYTNYKTVSDKISDALYALEIISNNGIADDEIIEWSKMLRLVEALIDSTRKWPSPSLSSNIDVSPAINDLQNIERGILSKQSKFKITQAKQQVIYDFQKPYSIANKKIEIANIPKPHISLLESKYTNNVEHKETMLPILEPTNSTLNKEISIKISKSLDRYTFSDDSILNNVNFRDHKDSLNFDDLSSIN